ncbi:transcription factor TT2 [Corchorus olitorius]|uniref:Transcription factor TT2 n=1 Tax=Corchorus olitorius TaxID=93759 RepID=A0A1R3JA81_9ROSI|nr:transcription factor TT2 [Corchorus olitorius]
MVRKLDHMKQHEVIRTKAVKCSKAVNVNIPFFSNDHYDNLNPKFENTNIASDHSSSSAMNVDDINNSTDFLVDFDINELLASDASILDFHDQIHQQVDENGKFEINGFNLVDEVDQIHEYSKSVDEAGLDGIFKQPTETMDLRSIASTSKLKATPDCNCTISAFPILFGAEGRQANRNLLAFADANLGFNVGTT